MFRDLQSLESILKIHHTKTMNWCSGPEFYWSVENSLRPGTVNLSPAWFAQGHEAKHHLLKVSLDLQNGVVLKWLCKCYCHLHLSVVCWCWVLCNQSCSNWAKKHSDGLQLIQKPVTTPTIWWRCWKFGMPCFQLWLLSATSLPLCIVMWEVDLNGFISYWL